MSFNKSVHPRNHHNGQDLNIFLRAKQFTCAPTQLLPSALCHQRFIFSRVSYEWNYITCTLSCLASFSIMLL